MKISSNRWQTLAAMLAALVVFPAAAEDSAPLPISLVRWKLTLPIDANHDGKADEVTSLAGYTNPPWFVPTPQGIHFRAVAGGARTSGSTAYARSELREMTAGGRPAAWDCTGDVRSMTLDQTLLHTTTAKPEATIGQIHDARNDNLMIRYVGPARADGEHDTGRIELVLNNARQTEVLDSAYRLADPMHVQITVDHGAVSVAYRNLRSSTEQAIHANLDPQGVIGACYFKAGVYVQACSPTDLAGRPNEVCAKKGWATSRYDAPEAWAEVLISGLSLE